MKFRNTISSSGSSSLKNGFYISQTIGQGASFTQKINKENYYCQGFQQPLTVQNNLSGSKKQIITVFPNPNNGSFHIHNVNTRQISLVRVFDAKGSLINASHSFKNNNEVFISIHDQASAVFMVNIQMNDGSFLGAKIIKSDL